MGWVREEGEGLGVQGKGGVQETGCGVPPLNCNCQYHPCFSFFSPSLTSLLFMFNFSLSTRLHLLLLLGLSVRHICFPPPPKSLPPSSSHSPPPHPGPFYFGGEMVQHKLFESNRWLLWSKVMIWGGVPAAAPQSCSDGFLSESAGTGCPRELCFWPCLFFYFSVEES